MVAALSPALENADPLFVKSNQGNFYLQAGSPCIDSGTSDESPLEDQVKIDRPQGAGIDMGAYEYVEPASCIPRASFTAHQAKVFNPFTMVFDASSSGAAGYEGAIFYWDFGDGSDGAGMTASHTYTGYGLFEVGLTITTPCGTHGLTIHNFAKIKSSLATREVGEGYAYSSIQEAIQEAGYGEIILVHDGLFIENINFMGKKITLRSENGAATTIIDGKNGRGDESAFFFHCDNGAGRAVIFAHGEDADSVLDGFTIQNGRGGISCSFSSPTITNCLIKENKSSPCGRGGGIYCSFSSPIIDHCTISGNKSGDAGGGIYCFFSSATISNCAISANDSTTSTTSGRNGGGIYCTSAYEALYYSQTPTSQDDNTGNSYFPAPTIINCLISKNKANYGGGIGCCFCPARILNCTIIENSAQRGGAGVYHAACSGSPSPTITNCILWGNVDLSGSRNDLSGCSARYSNIQDGDAGEGNISEDPLFLNTEEGDYRLQSGSPCIDRGAFLDDVTIDKNGVTRPRDGDEDGAAGWDMGAYEYTPTPSDEADGGPISIIFPDILRQWFKPGWDDLPFGFMRYPLSVNSSLYTGPYFFYGKDYDYFWWGPYLYKPVRWTNFEWQQWPWDYYYWWGHYYSTNH